MKQYYFKIILKVEIHCRDTIDSYCYSQFITTYVSSSLSKKFEIETLEVDSRCFYQTVMLNERIISKLVEKQKCIAVTVSIVSATISFVITDVTSFFPK